MNIKWLFFDLGGTVYDETLSDKQRIDNLIKKARLQITYNDFYSEMLKAAERCVCAGCFGYCRKRTVFQSIGKAVSKCF